MSAINEVCKMLDERGVEWQEYDMGYFLPSRQTRWNVGGIDYMVEVSGHYLIFTAGLFTPAQAIEATLGRGECHVKIVEGMSPTPYYVCSECGNAERHPFKFCSNCGAKVVEE